MAIRIIKESERLSYEYEGSTFYYRRLSAKKSNEFQKNFTKRGITEFAEMGLAIMQYCIIGWDDVLDADGSQVAYSSSLIEELPDDVITEITGLIREGNPQSAKASAEEQLGN